MKRFVNLVIFLSAMDVSGQGSLNRLAHLSKSEFLEIKKDKDQFIPPDFKADTVVIVKYTVARLLELQRKVRLEGIASIGEDTVGYTDEKYLGAKQVQQMTRHWNKFANDAPIDLSKILNKKGVNTIIVEEWMLKSNTRYANKYWLITEFICEQYGRNGGLIIWKKDRIYDPGTTKSYELFRPTNYDLMDLVD
jgi:hypothetical protein